MDGLIIGNLAETVDSQIFFDWSEIIVKQIFKNTEIIFHQFIDTSIAGSHLFTGHAERIFTHHKEKCQIIMPQIIIKSIICCHF